MTLTTLKWLDRSTTAAAGRPWRLFAQEAQAGFGRVLASLFNPVPPLCATAADLFDRAAAYEATQPGYAADLRAAGRLAQLAQRRGG